MFWRFIIVKTDLVRRFLIFLLFFTILFLHVDNFYGQVLYVIYLIFKPNRLNIELVTSNPILVEELVVSERYLSDTCSVSNVRDILYVENFIVKFCMLLISSSFHFVSIFRILKLFD